MLPWKFATYVSGSGRNDVQQEIDGYDDYASEAFQSAVRHLAVTSIDQWHEPHAKKLKQQESLYEIRYKANNRATRALGYFGSDGRTFVIVLICYHKQKIYTPPDALESAQKRIRRIENKLAKTAALKIDGEIFPPFEDEQDEA